MEEIFFKKNSEKFLKIVEKFGIILIIYLYFSRILYLILEFLK